MDRQGWRFAAVLPIISAQSRATRTSYPALVSIRKTTTDVIGGVRRSAVPAVGPRTGFRLPGAADL